MIASVLSQKCEVRRTLGREGRGLGDLRRSENTRTVVLESKTVDFCDEVAGLPFSSHFTDSFKFGNFSALLLDIQDE